MRHIINLLIVFMVCACHDKKVQPAYFYEAHYYEAGNYHVEKRNINIIEYTRNDEDSLIFKTKVVINNHYYQLSKYSNVEHAPIDGNKITYVLDDSKVLLMMDLSGTNYSKLQNTNDSINKILNTAIEYCFTHSEKNWNLQYLKNRKNTKRIILE